MGNFRLHGIAYTVFFCLFGKIQQHRIGSGIFAEFKGCVVGNGVGVFADIIGKGVVIFILKIILQNCNVVADIVFCPSCFGYFVFKDFVLHRLHGQPVVAFFKLDYLVLVENEAGDDIVDKYFADVYKKEKYGVFRPQGDLKTGA